MRIRAQSALPTALLALSLGGGMLPSPAAAQAAPAVATADYAGAASPEAIQLATWVTASADNHGRPFIVIDKVGALVLVFDARGQFLGETPALLGIARGDESVPGIGDRELSNIRPEQRTTPAGRFLASFGRALGQRKVLWVDYASSVALHPLVKGTRKERRRERLESSSSEDNRITYGCINISAAFFEKTVVAALEKSAGGVVYTLPETKPLTDVFPTFRAQDGNAPPIKSG
jgi:hypothetical protein